MVLNFAFLVFTYWSMAYNFILLNILMFWCVFIFYSDNQKNAFRSLNGYIRGVPNQNIAEQTSFQITASFKH